MQLKIQKKLVMAHQEKVRHCYHGVYGAPLKGAPLLTLPPLKYPRRPRRSSFSPICISPLASRHRRRSPSTTTAAPTHRRPRSRAPPPPPTPPSPSPHPPTPSLAFASPRPLPQSPESLAAVATSRTTTSAHRSPAAGRHQRFFSLGTPLLVKVIFDLIFCPWIPLPPLHGKVNCSLMRFGFVAHTGARVRRHQPLICWPWHKQLCLYIWFGLLD